MGLWRPKYPRHGDHVKSTTPLLSRLMEMLADPICPHGEYLALRTEETLLLLRISEGDPPNEVLAPASVWMFRLVSMPV